LSTKGCDRFLLARDGRVLSADLCGANPRSNTHLFVPQCVAAARIALAIEQLTGIRM
jgi:hypothetical protein